MLQEEDRCDDNAGNIKTRCGLGRYAGAPLLSFSCQGFFSPDNNRRTKQTIIDKYRTNCPIFAMRCIQFVAHFSSSLRSLRFDRTILSNVCLISVIFLREAWCSAPTQMEIRSNSRRLPKSSIPKSMENYWTTWTCEYTFVLIFMS